MWVLHSCGDIQLEFVIVCDLVVSNLDTHLSGNLHERFVEQVIKRWIKNFTNVLQKSHRTISYAFLELWNEFRIVHIEDLELSSSFIMFAHLLDPIVCLGLRVDVESPTKAFGDEYAILSREYISWELILLPLVDLGRIYHKVTEAVGWCVWDAELFGLLDPKLCNSLSVVEWEWALQTHVGGRQETVTSQIMVLLIKHYELTFPTLLLI